MPEASAPEAPVGFWADVAAAVRKELKPPASGFFAITPNAPIRAVLQGSQLILICVNKFTMEIINKPEILALVGQKASAKLGSRVTVKVTDSTAGNMKNEQMEQLLRFGRAHSDFVNIKE